MGKYSVLKVGWKMKQLALELRQIGQGKLAVGCAWGVLEQFQGLPYSGFSCEMHDPSSDEYTFL